MLNGFVAKLAVSFLPSCYYLLCILGDDGSVSWMSSWFSDDEAVNFQSVSDDIIMGLLKKQANYFCPVHPLCFSLVLIKQWSETSFVMVVRTLKSQF